MVDIDLIARYELLRREYDELIDWVNPLEEDEELDRLDAELLELESRLPEGYQYTQHGDRGRTIGEG
jgi:hypothetical protein